MTPGKSFIIVLRIVFVSFSLYFLKDAFYKWDGFSYHLRFINFLPDLSLVAIIWTFIGVIAAVLLWILLYGIFLLIPRSLIPVRLEHIMTYAALILLPLFIKRTFFSSTFSFSDLFGLNRSLLLIFGGVLVMIIIWLTRRHVDAIIHGLNERIAPLVWLFVSLLVLAVPFSIFIDRYPADEHSPDYSKQVTNGLGSELDDAGSDRPNIIFIVMDTLTARNMQLYGYERSTTPFISEWAKDAFVFSRAYTSSNWTTPSMMSIMTGQRVWTHGIWHLNYYRPVIGYYKYNFPAVIKDYGYDVFSFVQNPFAHPDTLSIKEPFLTRVKAETFKKPGTWWWDKLKDIFLVNPVVNEWIFEVNPIAKKIKSYRPETSENPVPPDIVYNRFLKTITERKSQGNGNQRPFFAWLHVFPPHEPYLPREPYMGMFGDAEVFNTINKQEKIGTGKEYAPEDQADIDIMRKRYDEFIVDSDKHLAVFLGQLSDTIDMSNTIIIFVSDHGESFSQGWIAHKGRHLYESITHVPMIIKLPGERDGKIIDELVDHTDIAPTILELAGIPGQPWIEGRSLVPLLYGRSIKKQPIFSMQFNNNRMVGGHPITKGTVAVWEGDYKFVYYIEDDRPLLYNMSIDPDETNNIVNEKPEMSKRFLKIIRDKITEVNRKITQSKENS